MSAPSKKPTPLGLFLTGAFFLSLVLAVGPGVYLANQGGTFLGMPTLYAWCVLWFFVISGIILTASLTVWKEEDE